MESKQGAANNAANVATQLEDLKKKAVITYFNWHIVLNDPKTDPKYQQLRIEAVAQQVAFIKEEMQSLKLTENEQQPINDVISLIESGKGKKFDSLQKEINNIGDKNEYEYEISNQLAVKVKDPLYDLKLAYFNCGRLISDTKKQGLNTELPKLLQEMQYAKANLNEKKDHAWENSNADIVDKAGLNTIGHMIPKRIKEIDESIELIKGRLALPDSFVKRLGLVRKEKDLFKTSSVDEPDFVKQEKGSFASRFQTYSGLAAKICDSIDRSLEGEVEQKNIFKEARPALQAAIAAHLKKSDRDKAEQIENKIKRFFAFLSNELGGLFGKKEIDPKAKLEIEKLIVQHYVDKAQGSKARS